MSLTSQTATLERLQIMQAGVPVVARISATQTVDYTTPRGTITRDNYEQSLYAIPSAETTTGGKRTRDFRCMLDDLPSVPLTELKIIYLGAIYSVAHFESGSHGVLLHTTRS